MSDVEFNYPALPASIVSGINEIDRLGKHMDLRGARRVMVLCGPNILQNSNVVDRVERALGERCVGRFSDVSPHSPVDVLRAALTVARRLQPDTLVSVGGGSTVTTAQGLALLLSTDRDLIDFAARFVPPDRVLPPMAELPTVTTRVVAVPTTMGAAEIGHAVGGFTDETRTHKIIVGGDGRTSPNLVVVDGEALRTTPRRVLTGTSMGQLRVAIESFASTAHNPISDAMALHAIRLLHQNLHRGWIDEVEVLLRIKGACMLASMGQAAMGTGSGKLGVNSAIAHQLGAICNVAHGEVNAILLPHTILLNAQALDGRLQLVAEALTISSEGRGVKDLAQDVSREIARLGTLLGLPARLRDVGVSPDHFEQVAVAALGDRALATNPVPIKNAGQIIQLLRAAW